MTKRPSQGSHLAAWCEDYTSFCPTVEASQTPGLLMWPSQTLPTMQRCMQVPSYPYYLANEPVQGQQQLEVADKYSGQVAYRVSVASSEEISR